MTMRIRRCAALLVELDDAPRFDVGTLFAGGDGLDRRPRWLAHAPALAAPCEVSLAQLALLSSLSVDDTIERQALVSQFGEAAVSALLESGLLLPESGGDPAARGRDIGARQLPWWPPALLAQHAGAWTGVDIEERQEAGLMSSSAERVAAHGAAPPHEHRRCPDTPATPLPPPLRRDFDQLLGRRRTCRNFDATATLPLADLSVMLHRVWGATGTRELAPGAVVVKKTSPAGGGLHAVEAYLLACRVDGLAPGLYHYLPLQHALEPMQALAPVLAAEHAHRFLAGQHWFQDVPALVVMTARFDRLFWKYRRHTKAWRVLHLDVGHLSQTMYLSAADLGLGAFVTAAINDRDVDQALDLPPLREGALAIVGFGAPSAERRHLELDALVPTPAARWAEPG
jgi:putative peptide maturation dehydrogenase